MSSVPDIKIKSVGFKKRKSLVVLEFEEMDDTRTVKVNRISWYRIYNHDKGQDLLLFKNPKNEEQLNLANYRGMSTYVNFYFLDISNLLLALESMKTGVTKVILKGRKKNVTQYIQ